MQHSTIEAWYEKHKHSILFDKAPAIITRPKFISNIAFPLAPIFWDLFIVFVWTGKSNLLALFCVQTKIQFNRSLDWNALYCQPGTANL